MYKKGEISEEQINTLIAIRNLTDEEWSQIKKDYIEGNIGKEEFEQIKQIREMPEDWTTLENGVKGLFYGIGTGAWEGIQWYLGGKLAGWEYEGSKVLTSAVRISVDTAFNEMDTPYRTLLDSLATGNTLEESWAKQGGLQSMLTDIGIGLISSTGGEMFDNIKEINIRNKEINIRNKVMKLYDASDLLDSASKMADYLEKHTNVMYNRDEYRKYLTSIFNELKKTTGEMESAVAVGRVFEKIFFDRGGFDEVLDVDGVKIKTIKDINWKNTQTDLRSIENIVRALPQKLKDSIGEIRILDLCNWKDPYWEVAYKSKDFISSCTGGDWQINVFGIEGKLSAETVWHEAGHCLDSKGGNYKSNGVDWSNAMRADLNINNGSIGVTEYATQAKMANDTNAEDFADSVKLFLKDEGEFQSKYPNRYQILKRIFN